jgi:hypothetical protein
MVGKRVGLGRGDLTTRGAPPADLPEHQAHRVHVRHFEGVEGGRVEGLVEHLRSHVADSLSLVSQESSGSHLPEEADREAEVGDGALPVALNQYVLALDVPVGDGRLAPRPEYLGVEVDDARCYGEADGEERGVIEDRRLEVVVEGAPLVVIRDEEHLGPGAGALYVGGNEAENVVVPHEDRLVDLGLAEPGCLLEGEEDLDRDLLAAPTGEPDLAVAALAHALGQGQLLGDGPLDEERQPRARAATLVNEVLEGALGGDEAGAALLPAVALVDEDHRQGEDDQAHREGDGEDDEGRARAQGPGIRWHRRLRLVHRVYVLVAEVRAVAADYALALEVRHQVTLALHEALLVRGQTAVGPLGHELLGLRVPDLLDGAEAVATRATLARPVLAVVRAVAVAVARDR